MALKFRGKDLSEARQRRVKEFGFPPEKSFIPLFQPVFETGEEIVSRCRDSKDVFIFLGTGMRPLFETVRGINDQDNATSRKNIRYLVIPKKSGNPEADIEVIRQMLIKEGIVTGKKTKYWTVDSGEEGINYTLVKRAINKIQGDWVFFAPVFAWECNR